jgi:hypothetical protein
MCGSASYRAGNGVSGARDSRWMVVHAKRAGQGLAVRNTLIGPAGAFEQKLTVSRSVVIHSYPKLTFIRSSRNVRF